MRIGIDLDNVINDLNFKWLNSYNLDHNDNLSIEDIHSWDIHEYVSIGEEIYTYLNNDLFKKLEPLHGSISVTKQLSDKHELFVITASSPLNLGVKWDWLGVNFPHIPSDNYIVAHRKEIVTGVDVLIDDGAHNIIDFPNETIVFDQPWNRSIGSQYRRAHNWEGVMKHILEIDQIRGENN